jgi:cell division transport system permease protein
MSLFNHAISSGIKNFTRNIWLSITAITVLTVSLSAVGFLSLVSTSLEFAIKKLDTRVSLLVFFNEGATMDDVNLVEQDVKANYTIVSSIITDKEQERKAMEERSPSNIEAFELVGNPLSYKLELRPESINDYQSIVVFLSKDVYSQIIDPQRIKNPSEIIENLKRVSSVTRAFSVGVILIFAFISILVMINILRLAVYNRREEIEIMRLVGATNSYIQSPFVVEGILYNCIAALIVVGFFIPLTNASIPQITSYLSSAIETSGATSSSTALTVEVFTNLGLIILAGLGIGIITNYTALQRYLQK